MDTPSLFLDDEVAAAVRVCFCLVLPEPVVDRVMELRIERRERIDSKGVRHLEYYKDDKRHGMWEGRYPNGLKAYESRYENGELSGFRSIYIYSD